MPWVSWQASRGSGAAGIGVNAVSDDHLFVAFDRADDAVRVALQRRREFSCANRDVIRCTLERSSSPNQSPSGQKLSSRPAFKYRRRALGDRSIADLARRSNQVAIAWYGIQAASGWPTKHLARSLRLCRCSFYLGTFGWHAILLVAIGHRLFHLDFLASVAVADFVSGAARDLRALITIGSEPMLANQRADACGFALDGVERIDAGRPDILLHAGVLVEEVEPSLRGCIPVAVDRTGVAADPAKFRRWSSTHRTRPRLRWAQKPATSGGCCRATRLVNCQQRVAFVQSRFAPLRDKA